MSLKTLFSKLDQDGDGGSESGAPAWAVQSRVSLTAGTGPREAQCVLVSLPGKVEAINSCSPG